MIEHRLDEHLKTLNIEFDYDRCHSFINTLYNKETSTPKFRNRSITEFTTRYGTIGHHLLSEILQRSIVADDTILPTFISGQGQGL